MFSSDKVRRIQIPSAIRCINSGQMMETIGHFDRNRGYQLNYTHLTADERYQIDDPKFSS
jgi:hypothetical protein